MATFTTTQTALALAKNLYLPAIRQYWKDLGGKKALFDREAPKRVRELSARGGVLALSVNPNMQGGFFTEGGNLPIEGGSNYINATFTYTRYAQAVRLSGDALQTLQREGETAFANIIEVELKGAVEALNILFNRYLNFDDKGALATVSAANATPSTTVQVAAGDRASFLAKDMIISLVDPTSGNYVSGAVNRTIVSIAPTNDSITLDQAVTCSVGDLIVQRQSYGLGVYGINYHLTANTWLGLDRATTYPNLKGIVIDAANNDLSAGILQTAASMIETMGGDCYEYVPIWSPAQEAKYKAAGYGLKRFVDSETVNLGFVETEFGRFRPFLTDRDTPASTIYFVNPKDFFWVNIQGLEWGTSDGQPMHIVVSSDASGTVMSFRDQYWIPLIWRGQFICEFPFRQAAITGLNFDATFRSRNYTTFG